MNKLAIVVTAYNRAQSLSNLLKSLNKIVTDKKIPLIISIDNRGTTDVNRIANEFKWRHGDKQVIIHEEKKGLRSHFIWVGDRTEDYNNILFLEDDLYVSPYILEFVEAAIIKYANDIRVSGVSLYNPLLCEFDKCKFYQYEDGYDNYFFQHPYWGNVWFRDGWVEFKKWLNDYQYNPAILPEKVRQWDSSSFKKLYIQYLAEVDRYMVFPRVSYVTNMGEIGLHNTTNLRQFQTSLQYGSRRLNLSTFDQSNSIYDVFFEYSPKLLQKMNAQLSKYDFETDLRGLRTHYLKEYVLTSRPVRSSIISFSNTFRPREVNVINSDCGNKIFLAKAKDVIFKKTFKRKRIVDDILNANYNIGIREGIYCILHMIKERLFN